MKKIFVSSIVAIAVISAVCCFNQSSSKEMNLLTMTNIEALSGNDDQNYANRDERTVKIWDDEQEIYHSMTVIDCNGKGDIVCP